MPKVFAVAFHSATKLGEKATECSLQLYRKHTIVIKFSALGSYKTYYTKISSSLVRILHVRRPSKAHFGCKGLSHITTANFS